MEMQSATIGELAKALCKAQSMIQGARKDSKNPFYKSSYADLASVTEAVREPFDACGLAYSQTFKVCETGPIIVTTLMHESGEWQRSELYLPANKLDAQQFGSAITYGRRYSLAAFGGVVQVDDDAEETRGFYNDFHKHKATMLAKLDSGEYENPDAIIAELSKKFKISGKDRAAIKALSV